MTEHYIEFRVYLRDGVDTDTVNEIAEQLKDTISDYVSVGDECAPPIFTQDVSYEVK